MLHIIQPLDPQSTSSSSRSSISASITLPAVLTPTSTSDPNHLWQSVSLTSTTDYYYNPSSTTCDFACTYDCAACSELQIIGLRMAPTTFSKAPTSVDGYTAPTLNTNPALLPTVPLYYQSHWHKKRPTADPGTTRARPYGAVSTVKRIWRIGSRWRSREDADSCPCSGNTWDGPTNKSPLAEFTTNDKTPFDSPTYPRTGWKWRKEHSTTSWRKQS